LRTSRPSKKGRCCPFALVIAYDCNVFHVKNGLGWTSQFGHPKIDKENNFCPLRLLLKKERLITKSVLDAEKGN